MNVGLPLLVGDGDGDDFLRERCVLLVSVFYYRTNTRNKKKPYLLELALLLGLGRLDVGLEA